MTNDPLANALNITPMSTSLITTSNTELVEKQTSVEKIEQDFEEVRQNYKNMISVGDNALTEILNVAKQSQSPRAFEVVATLISTLNNVNKDLLNLHKAAKDLAVEQSTNITNNTLVLTTKDMLELMKRKPEEE